MIHDCTFLIVLIICLQVDFYYYAILTFLISPASRLRPEGAVQDFGGDGRVSVQEPPDERARAEEVVGRVARHHDRLPRLGVAPRVIELVQAAFGVQEEDH